VIRTEAKARQIDPALVAALIHQESSFNPRANIARRCAGPDAGVAECRRGNREVSGQSWDSIACCSINPT
jgi:hypothetical protein